MISIGAGEDAKMVEDAASQSNLSYYVGAKNAKERIKYFRITFIQLMPGAVGLSILDSFVLETPNITKFYNTHRPEIEYLENGINGISTGNIFGTYSKTVFKILKSGKYLDLIAGCIKAANQYTS